MRYSTSFFGLCLIVFCGLLSFYQCSGDDEEIPMRRVASIQIDIADTIQGLSGDVIVLNARAFDQTSNPITVQDFVWSGSDATVATVSPQGQMTILQSGLLRITASTDGISTERSVQILVEDGVPVLTQIVIDVDDAIQGGFGKILPLTARALDQFDRPMSGILIVWSGTDDMVGQVAESGLLSLRQSGTFMLRDEAENVTAEKNIAITLISGNLISYAIDDIRELQGTTPFYPFLDESKMTAASFQLGIGDTDTRTMSPLDEAYYIYQGSAQITVGSETKNITTGSVIYIEGGQSRQIQDITEDLVVLIVSLKQNMGQSSSNCLSFTQTTIEAPRNSGTNIWNPFLNRASMTFGLYMLPRSSGGDGRLVHMTDELNIITKGGSVFETDRGSVDVKKGSIVFVKEGNGHRFRSLTSDIDILILWNK